MTRKEAFIKLQTSKELYVLMSPCTKLPFVACDEETADDQIFIYENAADIEREAKRFIEKKQPVQFLKIENKGFLGFYSNLFTMGVNCIVLNGFTENEYRVQIAELVKRPGSSQPDKSPWIENPALHLTAIYFMQEVRRQKLAELPDECKEMMEEILRNFENGNFIVVFKEKEGAPLLKMPNGDIYQPIFTDLIEFQKFNKNQQFKAAGTSSAGLLKMLAKEAKGFVINPTGVNFQIPIKREVVDAIESEKDS